MNINLEDGESVIITKNDKIDGVMSGGFYGTDMGKGDTTVRGIFRKNGNGTRAFYNCSEEQWEQITKILMHKDAPKITKEEHEFTLALIEQSSKDLREEISKILGSALPKQTVVQHYKVQALDVVAHNIVTWIVAIPVDLAFSEEARQRKALQYVVESTKRKLVNMKVHQIKLENYKPVPLTAEWNK